MAESNNKATENTFIKLGKSVDDNVFQFKRAFRDDDTFMFKFFTNMEQDDARFCILYINGMVDEKLIESNILQPIIQGTLPKNSKGNLEAILNQVILSNDAEKLYDTSKMIERIIQGDSLLLMDNCSEALIISTKGWQSRSISEPEAEKTLRGPREGFVEPILVNLSMIRRKLKTPDLKFKFMTLGVQSKTKVSICYIDGIVNQKILSEVFERLGKIDIDGAIGSGYLTELIKDSPYSPFKTIGSTERPDVAAAKLLEGRIIVVVDGSPVAMTLPFLFEEYFQANEDYYINYYFSSISRVLRILGFVITITSPAIYVALMTFHQEMLPTPLIISIFAARQGIPFPTIVETIAMLLVFELLREASIRMPSNIGQALNIVGVLVLGQAAVQAKLVSAPVIIVVALSGITGLMTPRIKGPVLLLRLLLVIISGFIGLYSFIVGIMALVLHLCTIRSFGVPYMMSFSSLEAEDLKDTAIRAPLWFFKKRQRFISGENKVRLDNRSKAT
jgi:spore germination protein KA